MKSLIINGIIGSQQNIDDVGTCLCREGLHALPKTMFDLFSKTVVFFYSGCVISVGGHEAPLHRMHVYM